MESNVIGRLWIAGRLTPSLNTMLRQHWRVQARERKAWEREVQIALATSAHRPTLATSRRRVEIVRVGGRTLDPDNLRGGVKWLVDALRHAGLLVDDTPAWLDLDVTQRPRARGESRGTEIRIYNAAESGKETP